MKGLLCLFFGHKYKLAQQLTEFSRRVTCERCTKSFAMDDHCKTLVDWDAEFHRLYESYGIEIKYLDSEFAG